MCGGLPRIGGPAQPSRYPSYRLANQLPVLRAQFRQARFERFEPCIEDRLVLLAVARELFDEFRPQRLTAMASALAVLQDFKVSERVRPGQERLAGIVVAKLATECDAGFLEHVAGVIRVRHQRKDIAEHLILMLAQKPHQQFRLFVAHWPGPVEEKRCPTRRTSPGLSRRTPPRCQE